MDFILYSFGFNRDIIKIYPYDVPIKSLLYSYYVRFIKELSQWKLYRSLSLNLRFFQPILDNLLLLCTHDEKKHYYSH